MTSLPRRAHLEQLLLRCASGDQQAFAEYYQQTSPVLATLAMSRCRARQRAEDVLVGVYVSIWRQVGTIESGPPPHAWRWTLDILDRELSSRGLPGLGSVGAELV